MGHAAGNGAVGSSVLTEAGRGSATGTAAGTAADW